MSTLASQITSLMIVYSTAYSRHKWKKASKLRITGLCAGNPLVTGEFPAQRASNTENVSIWWRHHESWLMQLLGEYILMSKTHFTKDWWAHNPNHIKNNVCSSVKNIYQNRSQFCTCHDSLAVMTCAKLLPDWIVRIEIRVKRISLRFQWQAPKPFAKWMPELTWLTFGFRI